jgi:hypothetical protein
MTDTRLIRTFGDNNPIHSQPAAWDGHRSVRLMGENFNLGLATTAYSYALSYDELTEVAERIALLWNLHLGVSNDDLRNPPPETNVRVKEDLRKRVMLAIFDPGVTEGFKGDRDLTTWQTDAVMRVLATTEGSDNG